MKIVCRCARSDLCDPLASTSLLFLEELFRIVCVGVAKVVIFYLTTKTFTTFFIFNYLFSNDLYIEKVHYSNLIIKPLFHKELLFSEADGKDSIFIIRKQKLLQLNCWYFLYVNWC